MKGTYLQFYFQEFSQHKGLLLYEWLLQEAKRLGIHGGSVFRGVAGFGRHGVLHEEHFFELASQVPMQACFIARDEDAQNLLNSVKKEGIRLFYVQMAADYEFTGMQNAET